MVNERLTEADARSRPGEPASEPKSSHTQRADFVASLGFLPKICCVERLYYEVRPSELDDACDRKSAFCAGPRTRSGYGRHAGYAVGSGRSAGSPDVAPPGGDC